MLDHAWEMQDKDLSHLAQAPVAGRDHQIAFRQGRVKSQHVV
jgi:hypothetical protein